MSDLTINKQINIAERKDAYREPNKENTNSVDFVSLLADKSEVFRGEKVSSSTSAGSAENVTRYDYKWHAIGKLEYQNKSPSELMKLVGNVKSTKVHGSNSMQQTVHIGNENQFSTIENKSNVGGAGQLSQKLAEKESRQTIYQQLNKFISVVFPDPTRVSVLFENKKLNIYIRDHFTDVETLKKYANELQKKMGSMEMKIFINGKEVF